MSVMLRSTLTLCLFLTGYLAVAQSPLKRSITLHSGEVTLETALHRISEQGGFSFSYNADILPIDSLVHFDIENEKVGLILDRTILRPQVKFREYDNYVIIFRDEQPKIQTKHRDYTIAGYIRNARTGQVIPYASVYQRGSNSSTLADEEGQYELTVSADAAYVGLSISKQHYLDTVIIVRPEQRIQFDISLIPEFSAQRLPSHHAPTIDKEKKVVEEVGVVGFFVPMKLQHHAANIREAEQSFAQISFLPYLSSNGLRSGNFKNNISVNLLAGYSRGTEGVELGGLVNINRGNMAGLQMAGLGNVVGGKTYGFQGAGVFNTSLNSVHGLQMAGFANYAQKTFYGIQLAGFNNMLVGQMKGAQVSGFNNLATSEFDGVQLAGFSNLAIKGISRFQGAGFFNYTQHAQIAQFSGFINLATKDIHGLQWAGFANYTHQMSGWQSAGFMNIASGKATGLQMSGFLNYATNLHGMQLGMVNIADSVKGVPLGFFSYVLNGYHHLQVGGDNLGHVQGMFKTGVDHLYNVFSGGIYLDSEQPLWSFGYGMGTAHTFYNKLELNLDATVHTLLPFQNIQRLDNILGQVDLQAAWHFKNYLSVFAGPSYNLFYSDPNATDVPMGILAYPPSSSRQSVLWNYTVKTWWGIKAGVRF